MATTADDVLRLESKVLALAENDRLRLVEKLMQSLIPGRRDSVEDPWPEEAERRLREFDASGHPGTPAEQVFEKAHALVERIRVERE